MPELYAFLEANAVEIRRATEWRWALDAATGRPYFIHPGSKTVQWEVPKQLRDAENKVRSLFGQDTKEQLPPPPPLDVDMEQLSLREVGDYTFGHVTDSDGVEQYAKCVSEGFAMPLEITFKWLSNLERPHMRVVRGRDGIVVAGTVGVPMGMYFNGKSVKCMGVTGVSVALHGRGMGCGAALIGEYVKDLASEEVSAEFPISCLYPTAPAFYRKFGYETAGGLYEAEYDMAALCLAVNSLPKPRGIVVRPVNLEKDMDIIKTLHKASVQNVTGTMDRSIGPYLWKGVHMYRGQPNSGYVLEDVETGELEGYVFVRQDRPDPMKFEISLIVQDMVARSERASHALLIFMASQRSIIDTVVMKCPMVHPWAFLLPHFAPKLYEEYMVRILNVREALRARGYPSHVTARLCLNVTDEAFAHNNGYFLLCIEKGHVVQCDKVTDPTEAPVLSVSVTKLAPLYTGYLNAQQLAAVGIVKGSAEAVAEATLVFGTTPGGLPCTTDFF